MLLTAYFTCTFYNGIGPFANNFVDICKTSQT